MTQTIHSEPAASKAMPSGKVSPGKGSGTGLVKAAVPPRLRVVRKAKVSLTKKVLAVGEIEFVRQFRPVRHKLGIAILATTGSGRCFFRGDSVRDLASTRTDSS